MIQMTRTILAVCGLAVAIGVLAPLGWAQEGGGRTSSAKVPKAPKATTATAASPVNLNTASAMELQTLPNVGPATAARILEYRQKNGGFKKIEDLMGIAGIGERIFLRLKPLVIVSPPKAAEK